MAILAVFIAGLMVGRTPEFLGKKIGSRQMTYVAIYTLTTPALVLIGTGLAMSLGSTPDAMGNPGGHGFSEVLYAYTSAANNNGSAFGGITVTSDFFQITLGLAMLLGRLIPIVFVLLLAGSLAEQGKVPATAGTLPTHKPLFVGLLVGVIVIMTGADLLPGALPRTDRGGPGMSTSIPTTPRPSPCSTPNRWCTSPPRRCRCATSRTQAVQQFPGRPPQARPSSHVALAGHVPGLARVDPDHGAASPTRASSRSRSRCGSGSPSIFGNLAEAVAEGRGKAQAASLRATRTDTVARRIDDAGREVEVPGTQLAVGDRVVVEAGQVIPATAMCRGHRQRGRVRDHGRVRPGHP